METERTCIAHMQRLIYNDKDKNTYQKYQSTYNRSLDQKILRISFLEYFITP